MNPHYRDYSEYLSTIFPGEKIQKLSVNTSHGCPNRDGTLGTGGCVYCSNRSFTPAYCFGAHGVARQLEAGKIFFGRKYPDMKYLAYLQSFSSTYGGGLESEINEALSVEGIRGLVFGSRPDSLNDNVLDILQRTTRRAPVFVEIGVESLHDTTLRLINRGHDSRTAVMGIRRAADRGLHVGVHLIAGLPGEDSVMVKETVEQICRLPVESLKLHQLQVLRGTPLADMLERGEVALHQYSMEEYLELCAEIVTMVPRSIAIERFLAQAPPEMVITPGWGVKNYIFTDKLLQLLDNMRDNRHPH